MKWSALSLLCLTLAGPRSSAATNRIARPAPPPPPAATNAVSDPVEQEYAGLLAQDDAAHAEVDRWIRENEAFSAKGADFSNVTLNARIEQRLKPIRDAYERFLLVHPRHIRARLAYGSFLSGMGEDDAALAQWQKARDLDDRNPAVWNNLADHYARQGRAPKAFECLDRAIALQPAEALYLRNLAMLVASSREEAQAYYRLADEQAALRRALELYRQARHLDPHNFTLATDLAQLYYSIEPPAPKDPAQAAAAAERFADEALAAWQAARQLARTDLERQGVSIHLARICLAQARWETARQHLAAVVDPNLAPAKQALAEVLERKAPRTPATTTKP